MNAGIWPRSIAFGLLLGLLAGSAGAQQASRVRAVLFFSPTCPHCHQVMTVDLPPLVKEFGDRLQVVTISTSSEAAQRLYVEAMQTFGIPEERYGVPALIVGSTVLMGSSEIPARFPGMIREALAGSGIDWPAVAGIRDLLAAQGLLQPRPADTPVVAANAPVVVADTAPMRAGADAGQATAAPPAPAGPAADTAASHATSTPSVSAAPTAAEQARFAGADVGVLGTDAVPVAGVRERFNADPVANGIAVAVLFLMLLALGAVAAALAGRLSWKGGPDWLIPVLAVIGMGVALYLAFVELSGARAVCGPVGDCNTVQQSPYARIAGVFPIGVLGVIGYLLLLGAWLAARLGPAPQRAFARGLLWDGALLGTLFSVYLTFLEPFVIGATCAWCISSALVMTALLLLSTPPALATRASKRAETKPA